MRGKPYACLRWRPKFHVVCVHSGVHRCVYSVRVHNSKGAHNHKLVFSSALLIFRCSLYYHAEHL